MTEGTNSSRRTVLPSSNSAFSKYARTAVVEEGDVQRGDDNILNCLTVSITKTYKSCNPHFKHIQTLPQRMLTVPSEPALNNGKDNADANLICRVHDKLGNGDKTFTILDLLGTGTFGQVFRCKRDGTKELVAVKVIKNKPAYHNQGKLEIKIAQLLNTQFDPKDEKHIVRLTDYFECHGHICLVFELLNMSLLDLLTQNQFRGLPLSLVQKYTKQILTSLIVLEDANIIHCDLKPENILLQQPTRERARRSSPERDGTATTETSKEGSSSSSGKRSTAHMTNLKVIDFGSACFEGRTVYSYIQSRFYRSPEVLLGCPYTGAIDMWSLACVCAEMYLGLPLFPGVSQHNQLSRIVEMFGNPPDFLIECKLGVKYFTPLQTSQSNNNSNSSAFPLQNAEKSTKYRIKTPEEYATETKTEVPVLKKYLKYSQLEDVILKCFPANKLKLTPEQKQYEIDRRKCFVDFLFGLFRLNPFERWTAKQAMQHPFIQGTPFTGAFVPPTDLKLQERKLMFMVHSQQRVPTTSTQSGGASSSAATKVAPSTATVNVPSVAVQNKVDAVANPPSTGASAILLGSQRVPTNFGSSSGLSASSAFKGVASNAAESSTISLESEERPMLRRGAPVHMKVVTEDDAAKILGISPQKQSSTSEHVTTPVIDSTSISAADSNQSESGTENEDSLTAPKPTGNVKHKPRRHSFTSRVEQKMLQPQLSTDAEQSQPQPTVDAKATSQPVPVPQSQAQTQQIQPTIQLSQKEVPLQSSWQLFGPSSSNQTLNSKSSGQNGQSQLNAGPSMPIHASSYHANSLSNFMSQQQQQQQQQQQRFYQQSSTHAHAAHSSAVAVGVAGQAPYQTNQLSHSFAPQHQQHHHHNHNQQQHHYQQQGQSTMTPWLAPQQQAMLQQQQQQQQQQATASQMQNQQQPLPEFYVGSLGGSFSNIQQHPMSDFAMALLRPEMDEHRRLHSQQSLNSSSGYWPVELSKSTISSQGVPQQQHQQHQHQHLSMGLSTSLTPSSTMPGSMPYSPYYAQNVAHSPLMMSMDSVAFAQQRQHFQQQQQQGYMQNQQMPVISSFSPLSSPAGHSKTFNNNFRSPNSNTSPTTRVMRSHSYSQEEIRRSALRNNTNEKAQQHQYQPPLPPSYPINSTLNTSLPPPIANLRSLSQNSTEDLVCLNRQSSGEDTNTDEHSSDHSVGNNNSSNNANNGSGKSAAGRGRHRHNSRGSPGKVMDALAEWDPFFESDD